MKQNGFTLIEMMVVILILAISAALVIPQFTGSQKSVKNIPTKDRLQQAYESVQDYYEGQYNVNGSGSYAGLTPAIMSKISSKFNWMESSVSFYQPANRAIYSKPNAEGKYSVKISAVSDQSFTLCNTAGDYTYCVKEDGGPKYGASAGGGNSATETKALSRLSSAVAGENCITKINRAQLFAQAVDVDGETVDNAKAKCSSN